MVTEERRHAALVDDLHRTDACRGCGPGARSGACSARRRSRPPRRAGGAQAATTRPSVAPAAGDPVWHYEGAEGPEHWGALSPKFAACGEGQSQSPVDIADTVAGNETILLKIGLPPAALKIAHHEHVADGINNGHTIQINYEGGDTLTIGNDQLRRWCSTTSTTRASTPSRAGTSRWRCTWCTRRRTASWR